MCIRDREEAARAFGFFGGGAGSRNAIVLTYPDGTQRRVKSKEIIRDIPPGTVFHQLAGGGGGYGDGFERPAERVAADVSSGVVSVQAAREDYGVVIDADGGALDAAGTAGLRARRKLRRKA